MSNKFDASQSLAIVELNDAMNISSGENSTRASRCFCVDWAMTVAESNMPLHLRRIPSSLAVTICSSEVDHPKSYKPKFIAKSGPQRLIVLDSKNDIIFLSTAGIAMNRPVVDIQFHPVNLALMLEACSTKNKFYGRPNKTFHLISDKIRCMQLYRLTFRRSRTSRIDGLLAGF